jgi:hypothetical protein
VSVVLVIVATVLVIVVALESGACEVEAKVLNFWNVKIVRAASRC